MAKIFSSKKRSMINDAVSELSTSLTNRSDLVALTSRATKITSKLQARREENHFSESLRALFESRQ